MSNTIPFETVLNKTYKLPLPKTEIKSGPDWWGKAISLKDLGSQLSLFSFWKTKISSNVDAVANKDIDGAIHSW